MSSKARAAAGLKRKIIGQLREIGIDVDAVLSGDASAQATAIHALKAVRKAMSKPAPWPTAPTDERRQKGQRFVAIEVNPGQPKAHAVIWPPDQISKRLSLHEHTAAVRYREAHEAAFKSSGVSSYGQSSGGGWSPERLEMTERQQITAHEFKVMTRALSPALQQVASNFILEVPIREGDRLMSWVEFGKAWTGVGDDDAARAWAQAALKSCCTQLAHALAALDAERRGARRKTA